MGGTLYEGEEGEGASTSETRRLAPNADRPKQRERTDAQPRG